MEKYLIEVIGIYLMLSSPSPKLYPEFICVHEPTYVQQFTLAIKSDCLFLAIFCFHRFASIIFNKISPPKYMVQKML